MHFQIADRVDQFPNIFRHSPKRKPPKNRAAKPFSQRAPCARCFYSIKIRKSPRGLRPRYRSCSPLSGCAPTGRRAPSPRRASPPPVGARRVYTKREFCEIRLRCARSLRSYANFAKLSVLCKRSRGCGGTPRTSCLFFRLLLTSASGSAILIVPRGAMHLHPRVKPAGNVSPQLRRAR